MAQDFEQDTSRTAQAPSAWSETMIQAALEAGLAANGTGGVSVTRALARATARLGQWAEDATLADKLNALLAAGQIMLDAPLLRAAMSDGAELTISTALLRWPTNPREELEAVARAQTLLAAGAKLGIAGACWEQGVHGDRRVTNTAPQRIDKAAALGHLTKSCSRWVRSRAWSPSAIPLPSSPDRARHKGNPKRSSCD
ncbi:MAG: hypothetical protein J0L81_18455 [Caulobacterales bacterium]|nr:hypothetical protein [Caulobacterales bacterium]